MKKLSMKLLLLAVTVLSVNLSFAQLVPSKQSTVSPIIHKDQVSPNGFVRCHTMEADSIRRALNPSLPSLAEQEAWLQNKIQQFKVQQAADEAAGIPKATLLTIPVVVHVIHNGDAIGSGENIADGQCFSQVQVFNEDFRRMLGTPGYNSHPDGADIEIEFCWAVVDPSGNPTNGIDRVNYGLAEFTTNASVETMKTTTQWDPTQYMNMWTVRFGGGMAGTLGYAQFPDNSGLAGMPGSGGAANTDGVVSSFDAFGSANIYPAGNYNPTYNLGRTMTHEVGHWLGLRHIWGDGNCGVDDFCNDTPLSDASNFGCPNTNSCTDPAPDPNDMVENYMDYTDDACMNIFTQDQKTRMRTVLTVSPRRMELPNSTVCIPPVSDDAGISAIITPTGTFCTTTFTPEVTLKNFGNNDLLTVDIIYDIDGGAPNTFSWSGTLTPLSTVNVTLPSMTTTAGAHTFNAWTDLPNGTTDGYPANDGYSSMFTVDLSSGTALPIVEGFVNATFPPTNWSLNNGGNALTWVRDGANGTAPTAGNSATIDNYNTNTTSDIDDLVMPATDFTGLTSAQLSFDVAYARYDATYNDQLDVLVSNDCGQTWSVVYSKASTVLATDPDQTAAYTSPATWRNEVIDLSAFVGSSKVEILFRNISGWGQYLYLDNINLTGVAGCTDPDLPTLTYTGGAICEGSTATISIAGNLNDATDWYVYSGSCGGTLEGTTATGAIDVTPSAPSTTYFIRGEGGCVTPGSCDQITINATAVPVISAAGFSDPSSCGATDGSITIGGSGTGDISWSGAATGSATSVSLPYTITGLGQGTYNIVFDNGCPSNTVSQALSDPSAPSAPTVTVTDNCGSSTLTATGTNLLWSTGETTASITVTTGGTYTVTQTVGGCASGNGSGTAAPIAIPSAPTVTVTDNCGSSTLTATGTNLLWSTGETTPSITVTTGGTYTVNQTVSGCTSADASATAAPLTIPSAPTVSVSDACGSSVLTATGTNLLWSTGETTPSITVTVAGTYTVNQTVGGCTSADASVTAAPLTIPAAPTVTVTDNCGSSTLTATGTNLLWSTGETSASITVTSAGTYTVTQTVGGCTSANGSGTANPMPLTPSVVTLLTPADLATNVSTPTSFTWTAAPETGVTYTIEISTDPGFSTIVDQATGLGTNSYTSTALLSSTTYYWHVLSTTVCGSSVYTGTFEFTTDACTLYTATDVPITISATGTPTITSTINVPTGGSIIDVNVIDMFGIHNRVRNLQFILTSPMGTSVTLMDQVCNNSMSDFDIDFDDAAASAVIPCPPTDGNAYQPNGVLSAFNGEDPTGNWTLTVNDLVNNNGGELQGWSLEICVDPVVPCTDADVPTLSYTGGAICEGSTATISIAGNLNDATDWYVYSGSCGGTLEGTTATGSIDVTPSAPSTTYFIRGEGGCVTPGSCDQITINATAVPVISAAGFSDPSSCGAADGSITIGGSGTGDISWSGAATGSATSVSLPYTITGLGQGTYNIVFDNGCPSNTVSQALSDPSAPSAPTVTVTDNCGSSTLTATGTNLLWSTGETTASITVTTGGTYTVTQTVGGCTSGNGSGTAAPIAIPSAPTVTVTDNCGSSTLTATGTNLLWSTGETTPSITVTTGGTYTVNQTVSGCTSADASATAAPIAIPIAPTVTVTDGCGSSVLTATGTNLLWSTGATAPSITVATAGTYTVNQTVGGCTSADASVTAAPNATPSAPSVSVSNGCGSSVLTATGTNLLWSTGETTASITVTTAGTYTVTQTVGGCTSANGSGTAAPVAIPSAPTVTVTDNCGSSTLTATGTNLLWSTGATAPSITVTTGGTYTVNQTVGGCTSADANVTAAPIAIPNAPTVTVTDGCGSSVLTATGSNLLWSTGETTASITVTTAGTYTVNQTVGGCTSANGSATATPIAIPNAPAVTVTDGCGSSVLTASGSNLLWSTGETTAFITVTTAGTYTVNQTVGGCTSADATATAAPIAIPSAPVVTVTDGCGSSVLTATGSNLLWSTGETTPSITVITAGTYTVNQTVGGCTSTDGSATASPFTVPSAPTISASGATTFCEGGSVDLTSSQATGNDWSTTETTQTITVTTSGSYTVTYTDGNGCFATSAATDVIVNPLPIVTLGAFADVCLQDAAFTLSGGSPAGGVYTGPGVTGGNFDPAASGTGVHSITYTYTDGNGCSNSATADLRVDDCTGLGEMELAGISVYPNPTMNDVHVNSKGDQINMIKVIDGTGRIVSLIESAGIDYTIDLSEYATGVYNLEIYTSNKVFRTRVLKQ